ncbi:hypothetical protein SVAN01_11966, partial [Stagonosporopsis vannaccii]
MTPWSRERKSRRKVSPPRSTASREVGRKVGSWQVAVGSWQAAGGSASADVSLAVGWSIENRAAQGTKGRRRKAGRGASRRLTRGGLMIAQRALQVTPGVERARRESSARSVETHAASTRPCLHGAEFSLRRCSGAAEARRAPANHGAGDGGISLKGRPASRPSVSITAERGLSYQTTRAAARDQRPATSAQRPAPSTCAALRRATNTGPSPVAGRLPLLWRRRTRSG